MRLGLIAPVALGAALLMADILQAQETGVDFQESTNNVLAALGVVAPEQIPDVVVDGELIAIVGEAMASGKSSRYINALVMEAHSEGQVQILGQGMGADSSAIDSAALLAAVVNAAIAAHPAQTIEKVTVEEVTVVAALEPTVQADVIIEEAGRTHKVKPGDTLNRIAQRYYGAAGTYQQILRANPEITNANLISVGMVLRIPE